MQRIESVGSTTPHAVRGRRATWFGVRAAFALVVSCAQATPAPEAALPGPAHFVDQTTQAGVQHSYVFPPGTPTPVKNFGGGAVAEDLDGDRAIDLYVSNGYGPKSLYWNNGDGTFTEAAAASGAASSDDWTAGVAAADLDNDGDQDLLLVNAGADRLLINEGGRVFREAGRKTGLELETAGHGASFGDVDGDGWLDVFVGRSPVADTAPRQSEGPHPLTYPYAIEPSNLFLSNGDGTWRDASAVIVPGGLPAGNSFVGGLIDLDADADIDLFLVQDTQNRTTNRLFENVGAAAVGDEHFQDVTSRCGCGIPTACMGLAVVDLDNNGLPDLFVTNLISAPPNREVLLMNYGGLQFQDFAEQLGATSMDAFSDTAVRSASWAAMALDATNDGLEDLYVVYSPLTYSTNDTGAAGVNPEIAEDQPNALIEAQTDGTYAVAAASGLEDTGLSHAAVTADFDGDGCEDVFVVNIEGPSRLYHNECRNRGHFVDLLLTSTRSNRDAIGARVRVETAGNVYTRQVLGCSVGASSCLPKRLHIGLGQTTSIDRVRIIWPTGGTSDHADVGVDRLNVIVEPAPGTRPTGSRP